MLKGCAVGSRIEFGLLRVSFKKVENQEILSIIDRTVSKDLDT